LKGLKPEFINIPPAVFGYDLTLGVKNDKERDKIDIERFAFECLHPITGFGVIGKGQPGHFSLFHIVLHVFFAVIRADEDDFKIQPLLFGLIIDLDQLGRERFAGSAPVCGKINGCNFLAPRRFARGIDPVGAEQVK